MTVRGGRRKGGDVTMSSFMQQEITDYQAWYEVDGPQGVTCVPADVTGARVANADGTWRHMTPDEIREVDHHDLERYWSDYAVPSLLRDFVPDDKVWSVELTYGYGARMSAPGYMDCTEWSVFPTVAEAQDYLAEQYGDDDEPEDEDEDAEPTEPEEGDYVTEDHQRFYVHGSHTGKPVVTVPEGEDWRFAVRQHMDAQRFWPNVWFISDHGNAHMLTLAATWDVVVGNVGTVYSGTDADAAKRHYDDYVAMSKQGAGRVAGEPVTLLGDSDVALEYLPEEDEEEEA